MEKKAFYNILQFKLAPEKQLPFILKNYRTYPLDALFSELDSLHVTLDSEGYLSLSTHYETPEELAAAITKEDSPSAEMIYLIVFELWRRLLPEKQVLSIFCDELDHLIYLYETEELVSIEPLQEMLFFLQNILEENLDAGIEPRDALVYIQNYLAHDIESFLFDYILAEIEGGNLSYARDLNEGFYPYIQETLWYDYLLIRIAIAEDLDEGFEKLERLIETLKEEPDLDLQLEILTFLAHTGQHSLFTELTNSTLFQLEVEEDFLELTALCLKHFRYLEIESLAQQIELLLANRPQRDLGSLFSKEDPDLISLHRIFSQKTLIC